MMKAKAMLLGDGWFQVASKRRRRPTGRRGAAYWNGAKQTRGTRYFLSSQRTHQTHQRRQGNDNYGHHSLCANTHHLKSSLESLFPYYSVAERPHLINGGATANRSTTTNTSTSMHSFPTIKHTQPTTTPAIMTRRKQHTNTPPTPNSMHHCQNPLLPIIIQPHLTSPPSFLTPMLKRPSSNNNTHPLPPHNVTNPPFGNTFWTITHGTSPPSNPRHATNQEGEASSNPLPLPPDPPHPTWRDRCYNCL